MKKGTTNTLEDGIDDDIYKISQQVIKTLDSDLRHELQEWAHKSPMQIARESGKPLKAEKQKIKERLKETLKTISQRMGV
jgi:ElaB/YqjD/DUF883 family membrane-anchored ribosome-binding protein